MNPFTIAKDIKNIEKMLKPALEKYIQGAGFAKSDEINESSQKDFRTGKENRESRRKTIKV